MPLVAGIFLILLVELLAKAAALIARVTVFVLLVGIVTLESGLRFLYAAVHPGRARVAEREPSRPEVQVQVLLPGSIYTGSLRTQEPASREARG